MAARLKSAARTADPLRRMSPSDHDQTRRVVLPNGEAIDVVFLQQPDAKPSSGARRHKPPEQLHICPSCHSPLVAPVAWSEAGPAHWDVTLRCPNCEWFGGGVFDEQMVETFDEELDRGTEALVRDLQRLIRANMEDDVDRFLAALAADQIWPMDF
jgi:hypothetical protein